MRIRSIVLCFFVSVLLATLPAHAQAVNQTIQWDPYTPPADFKEFAVYRGIQACTAQGPLAPLVIGGTPIVLPKPATGPLPTTFTDTTVPAIDGQICYELVSRDLTGNEGRSNRATKTVNLDPPPAVLNLRVQ